MASAWVILWADKPTFGYENKNAEHPESESRQCSGHRLCVYRCSGAKARRGTELQAQSMLGASVACLHPLSICDLHGYCRQYGRKGEREVDERVCTICV